MLQKLLKTALTISAIIFPTLLSFAQSPVDGFFPKENSFTGSVSYAYKSFDDFYEGGTLASENPAGLGEITSSIISIYAQYGITDKISAIVTLPYITTSSELEEDPIQLTNTVSGVQDVGLFIKGLISKKRFADYSKLSLGGAIGVSLPVGQYLGGGVLSLGNRASSLNTEAILLYENPLRFFVELKAGSILNTSNEFDIPSALTYGAKLGYLNKYFYTHVEVDVQNSVSGIDIGSQEFINEGEFAIFPETQVDYTNLSFNVYIPIYEDIIGVSGNYFKRLTGRNVPNDSGFSGGLVYQFD